MGVTCDDTAMDGLTRTGEGRYASTSAEATQALGELLGALLGEGDLVILTGDLGAGKTQLTKGVARALGCTDDVTSPTFNIMAVHRGETLDLYHFDLYRLDNADQLGDAGVLDVAGVEGASAWTWPYRAHPWRAAPSRPGPWRCGARACGARSSRRPWTRRWRGPSAEARLFMGVPGN